MTDETEDNYGFDQIPLAWVALASRGTARLSPEERDTIQMYALGGYERINKKCYHWREPTGHRRSFG